MKNSLVRKYITLAFVSALSAVFVFACACSPGCGFYLSTLDWAVDLINAYYYYDVSEDDVRAAGLENLSGNVLDIYSGYYTADEYRQLTASNAGSRSGIGISYSYIDPALGSPLGGGVYVVSVIGNSPAARSGLRPGSFVTGVKTEDGDFAVTDSASFSSCLNAVAEGEEFVLVTDRGEYSMAKREYSQSYCAMASSEAEWTVSYGEDGRGDMSVGRVSGSRYDFLPEGTACIFLSQFYGNAAEEMAALLSEFNASGFTSLILDLRNNGGGYVEVMQKLAHLFTADLDARYDAAMYAEYKDGSVRRSDVIEFTSDSSACLPAGTRVTVLANSSTASASEALIGVLISNGVIGYGDVWLSDFSQAYLEATGSAEKNCRTYGKGIMQSTWEYWLTGEALKLTVAKIYWPDGVTCIHDVGLTEEDGCRTAPAVWSVTYDDEELRAVASALAGLGEAA